VGGSEAAVPGTPPEEVQDSGNGVSGCGLTPASLKHLRRQNAKLTEEKDRLQTELERTQALIRELRERIAALEEQLRASALREEKLQEELQEAQDREEAERKRAEEAERQNARLEASLAEKEAEVARLRQALEDQLALTKEVCEAAERSARQTDSKAAAASSEEIARLTEQVRVLTTEKESLQKDRDRQDHEHAELQQRMVLAMAAAEKAMTMHAHHLQRVEQLRIAKLADAIQHKVELHISVPRVTLHYNNAPPLQVGAASALGEERIKEFLAAEVFSQFEPLWVTLDGLDQAPDGTSKKAYSTRMLERLTTAVKGFVEKSQKAEGEGGLKPSVQEVLPSVTGESATRGDDSASLVGGGANHGSATGSSANGGSATGLRSVAGLPALGRQDAAAGGGRPRASQAAAGNGARGPAAAGGEPAMASLQEVDRERLLGLLRSGDDRGLDNKLRELLQSRA
jgi:chemotaxis protein histidine kinase CheA